MKLTQEQQAIIHSEGNIKINAIAGSGKTTTVIEYARARPKSSKILYLAFNKSVKLEAIRKFAEKGLSNVKVETTHSLAYKNIVFKHNYKVRLHGYKIHEIAELLGLRGSGEKHIEYVIANHINKFISYFCNSSERKVQALDYLEIVSDPKARTFVKKFYKYIEKQTRLLLGKMDKGEIEITHDFYLKKFQLSNPKLPYDYILFDEGQDASAAMLDVFIKQKATKVIVGDTHQQIYGWRFAVNSLEKTDFKNYFLSTSFRFSQDIANLATDIIKWKERIKKNLSFEIKGKGRPGKIQTKAIIARTNLGLLLRAIEYVQKNKNTRGIYFEGNINSYTYADEGASLYDVLNLHNQKSGLIRDKLIKKMSNLKDLEDYIEKTEDAQLAMMVEIVKEYGNKIPGLIKDIKEKHIDNDDKENAEMVFTTVHRCKGMEYDCIHIVNDFITEEKLEKQLAEINKGIPSGKKSRKEKSPRKSASSSNSKAGSSKEIRPMEKLTNGASHKFARLNEEINLLYVAVTRAKSALYIPEDFVPVHFVPSKQIRVVKKTVDEDSKSPVYVRKQSSWESGKKRASAGGSHAGGGGKTGGKKPSYSMGERRKRPSDAYKPWTRELEHELSVLYCDGVTIGELASYFGRTKGAIQMRINKLGLESYY